MSKNLTHLGLGLRPLPAVHHLGRQSHIVEHSFQLLGELITPVLTTG
jgi:hypothetical protein